MTHPDPVIRPHFKAIVAMAKNRVIGAKGSIPWHLSDDLKWFKKTTIGGVLVMGRKTFDSIGRPLPGRETIVISRSVRSIEGVKVVGYADAVLELQADKPVWIVGGEEIYRQLLAYCSELFVTQVHLDVEGDAFFPVFEDQFRRVELVSSCDTHSIERWQRGSSSAT